ncbi:MAG: glycosyltransferase family 4 protein [Candidatus Eisenbacteria bacterium]|nr:glycosyltransferase family 4 protein [Candidatus Eisenbacteria bacterium]
MRVCIVVPYDIADEGGVKRHAFHLADALRRAGDEVTVAGPWSRGTPPAGVHGFGGIVNIPANGAANHMALLVAPWTVGAMIQHGRFDVVHHHEPLVPVISWYALRLPGRAAHVATFHMYAESEPAMSRVARAVVGAALLPAVQAAIAVSPAAADYAGRVWKRPLHVIPNGVPTATFRPPAAGEGSAPNGTLRLLFVGNWRDPRKGLPVLLDAYRRLLERGEKVSLDIVGQGTPDASHALPGVTIHGPIGVEETLAERYRRCDLFISPATGQESFGIVLLEAMACGRPVVCSDIRGYRDVVDLEGARLIPPGDGAALAGAIAELARDPARRSAMGERNRLRAERYGWSEVARQVREVYAEAIASRCRAARS